MLDPNFKSHPDYRRGYISALAGEPMSYTTTEYFERGHNAGGDQRRLLLGFGFEQSSLTQFTKTIEKYGASP